MESLSCGVRLCTEWFPLILTSSVSSVMPTLQMGTLSLGRYLRAVQGHMAPMFGGLVPDLGACFHCTLGMGLHSPLAHRATVSSRGHGVYLKLVCGLHVTVSK